MCINSDFSMNKNEILLWFILIWKMINKYNLEQLSIPQHEVVFTNDMSLKLQLSRTKKTQTYKYLYLFST